MHQTPFGRGECGSLELDVKLLAMRDIECCFLFTFIVLSIYPHQQWLQLALMSFFSVQLRSSTFQYSIDCRRQNWVCCLKTSLLVLNTNSILRFTFMVEFFYRKINNYTVFWAGKGETCTSEWHEVLLWRKSVREKLKKTKKTKKTRFS